MISTNTRYFLSKAPFETPLIYDLLSFSAFAPPAQVRCEDDKDFQEEFCPKFKGQLNKLPDDCPSCSNRSKFISCQFGGVYSFGCAVVAKASLVFGDRQDTERYCDDPDELNASDKETTFGQLPNQVPQAVFRNLTGKKK